MSYDGTSEAVLANYSEVLKTFYLPAIQKQLNEDTILSDLIDTNEEDVSGKNATIECHYGRSSGVGVALDGGALPDAGYQKFKTCTVPMRYNYGRVAFSGPTIAATRDDKGSYARVIDTEITGIVNDLQKEINRQLWGCGYGMLGHCVAADSTAIELAKAYRGNTWGDGFGSTFGGKYFKEFSGGNVVIVASLGSSAATDFAIDSTDIGVTAVTDGTTTDTLTNTTPGQNTAEGDFLVRPGAVRTVAHTSAAGYGRKEMMGLRGIVTDQNLDEIPLYNATNGNASIDLAVNDGLQGLVVGTYTWWKAQVDSTSTRYGAQRPLTFELMQKMFDKVEETAGKDYGPNLILTTRALRREYLDLCQTDRRSVNTMTLDGGWEALDYNGVGFTVDNDAIDGEIYFLTTRDLAIYRMSDYAWMEKDGSILSRVTGYDAYEAVLFRYAELGCKRRNTQGVLCDLSYTL